MAYASQKDQIPVFFEDTSIAFASKSNSQLRKTYWLFSLMNQAQVVNLGTFFIKIALKLHLPIKNLIRHTIFEQFCGGETISDCQQTISTLANSGVGTILDYSVEGEDSENSFDATAAEILRTILFLFSRLPALLLLNFWKKYSVRKHFHQKSRHLTKESDSGLKNFVLHPTSLMSVFLLTRKKAGYKV
jgi:hypothetical protein